MEQLEQAMGRLRLLLAQVAQKREQSENLKQQFERQMSQVASYGSYGQVDLDQLLILMADMEDKLSKEATTLRHLSEIERKARAELDSLELTRRVEQAKAELASLEGQANLNSDQRDRVRALHRLISEDSGAAARRIAGGGGH